MSITIQHFLQKNKRTEQIFLIILYFFQVVFDKTTKIWYYLISLSECVVGRSKTYVYWYVQLQLCILFFCLKLKDRSNLQITPISTKYVH